MSWFRDRVSRKYRGLCGPQALTKALYTEILVFGTGKRLVPPPPSIRQYLNKIGIQIDVMDTVRTFIGRLETGMSDFDEFKRNACSTYNLLTEEGRRMAAALLPMVPQGWRS